MYVIFISSLEVFDVEAKQKLENPKLNEESLDKIMLLQNFDFSETECLKMPFLPKGLPLSLALHTLNSET